MQTADHAETCEMNPLYVAFAAPLDADRGDDAVLSTTGRRMARLALVAAETATRFARSGVELEPMAWMAAPRLMFGGASALEACGDRRACMRALVLHGVGEGLDADPALLDCLIDDEDDDEDVGEVEAGVSSSATPFDRSVPGPGRMRLFSAVVAHEGSDGFVQAFAAMVAPSPETLRQALRERHGPTAAAAAVIEEGFVRGAPLVDALVAPALAHVLDQVAEAPDSPLAAGLDVLVEQRFRA